MSDVRNIEFVDWTLLQQLIHGFDVFFAHYKLYAADCVRIKPIHSDSVRVSQETIYFGGI